MLAKLIVYGSTRAEAIERRVAALELFAISGIGTTIPFLHFMMARAEFIDGQVSTHLIDDVSAGFPAAGASDARGQVRKSSPAAVGSEARQS